MSDRRYWTYILASRKNGTLYIGCTSDLGRRVEQHQSEAVESFTRKYGVHRLVYAEPHATREEARVREHRLKRWPRAWKVRLIEQSNPDWKDLFEQYGA